ncbi:hypothetical protein [Prauserella alba]|uniref:Uncharacterized protein n=1 Tax=Prauserella alba TaxID=176898 RepID=A0ABP4FX07_9PSEU|nr:hypothetical protein [Prauserella alba]MCP2181537.1 hypothetical protein [Prauserella alba]
MSTEQRAVSLTVTPGWIGGIAVSGTGAGLATAALTLPWLRAEIAADSLEMPVTAIAGYGPVVAVLLVLTGVLAGVGFVTARRSSLLTAAAAVMLGSAMPMVVLWTGWQPPRSALLGAIGTVAPDRIPMVAPDVPITVVPMQGAVLYVLGLLLISAGTAVAAASTSGGFTVARSRPGSPKPRVRAALSWVAVAVAAPLAVLSLSLEWFAIEGRWDLPTVVAGWRTVYRIGLVLVLGSLLGTLATSGAARRVWRVIGLFCTFAISYVLSINGWVLADPAGFFSRPAVDAEPIVAGRAYLAAVGAVLLLLLAFLLGPGTEARADEPPDPDGRADPADGAAADSRAAADPPDSAGIAGTADTDAAGAETARTTS